jgi:hypothetical protein
MVPLRPMHFLLLLTESLLRDDSNRIPSPPLYFYSSLEAESLPHSHEGNTEEENNVNVVLKWNIYGSAGKEGGDEGGGGRYSTHPHPKLKRMDRYLKMRWDLV